MDTPFKFPPLERALTDPNGLLAMGGSLNKETLLDAYSQGIFPWYDIGQPVLWWSPDPRAVIVPSQIYVSRSLRKTMRNSAWLLTLNKAFAAVIQQCSETRPHADGTWITPEMMAAYIALHEAGYAHSVEVWQIGTDQQRELVGGLYGVAIGKVFSGESMFHRRSDASKIALATLCLHMQQIGWLLIDCQIPNPHLSSMGAIAIPRQQFIARLQEGIDQTGGLHSSDAEWATLQWQNTAALEQAFR